MQFRRVRRRQTEASGGVSWIESWQVRYRDNALAQWMPWQDIDVGGFVYTDESGNEISAP